MVKLYRSDEKSLLLGLNTKYNYTLKIESQGKKAWGGLITLLSHIRENRPNRYKQILKEHKAFLSLLYDDIVVREPSETRKINQIVARTTSHLTHNWYIQQPFFVEASVVFNKLVFDDDLLLVSNLFSLDHETIILLVDIIRQKKYPDMIIGYLEITKEADLDGRGIQWEFNVFQREEVILCFFYCENFQFIDLIDKTKESYQKRKDSYCVVNEETTKINSFSVFFKKFKELKKAFQIFGYTQVLFDGICLVDFIENQKSLKEDIKNILGELYALVALSAHNRQFTSVGHEVLARFIEKNLIKALEYELAPALKAATFYRLAVIYGRRMKKFKKSIDVCNEMISFIRSAQMTNQEYLYQLGWAYNIRAYNFQLIKNRDQARSDIGKSEEYFEELKQFIENSDDNLKSIWTRDAFQSYTLPLYNKSRTLSDKGDIKSQANKIFQYFEKNGFEDLNEAENKLGFYKHNHNLRKAIVWAKMGVNRSVQNHRAFKEQYFRSELAALYYKYGDIKASKEQIDLIEKNYIRFRKPSSMPDISLSTIMIKIRALEFNDVFKILDQNINDSNDTNILAELYATRYLARILSASELDFNKDKESSIDIGLDTGNAGVMLRVISIVGCALKEIGDIDSLKEAYNNGIEIIDYGIKNEFLLPQEHVLNILIGYQELFGLDEERMRFVDENLESILYVSESWWIIPRIVDLVKNKYSLSKRAMEIITQRSK